MQNLLQHQASSNHSMASRPLLNIILLILLTFFSCPPYISTLSTLSISENSNNQTLICALTHPPNLQKTILNCTSFPLGIIQIPLVNNSNISYSGVAAGDGFQCLVRSPSPNNTSVMGCYRFSNNGTNMSYKRIYIGPLLDNLVASNSRVCGLVLNGTTHRLECWLGLRGYGSRTSRFASGLAMGDDFVCGLSENGTISCLGNDLGVVNFVPEGTYSMISAGFRRVCAVSLRDNGLRCWGDVAGEKPPEGRFVEVAVGDRRSCGLRTNSTVACWGEGNFSLPGRLQGSFFVKIEAERRIFCGVLLSNFSLHCWGSEVSGAGILVLEHVLPGPCRSACPCGPLPGSGKLCSRGLSICQHCVTQIGSSPRPPSSPPPLLLPEKKSPSFWNGKMVAFLVVGCVGSLCFVVVCCFLIFIYCKRKGCRVHDSGPLNDPPTIQTVIVLSQNSTQRLEPHKLEKRLSNMASMGSGRHLEEFTLQELMQATNNFSEVHKVGIGSFGSVYRATLDDGREVAIKRAEHLTPPSNIADATRRQENKNIAFTNELESLSRLNHKNLVRLLGYCEDDNELALVYEYMNNGTLYDHLHKLNSSPLRSWTARLRVALDAARGIEYLHTYVVPSVIHRDIKSSNILLDSSWTAKVSDFGLSLRGPEDEDSHLSLHAAGTVGYIDPEYYRLQQLTTKSDVYSFGVVLLELLSGNKAIQKNESGVPRNVVDFVVPYVEQDEIHRVLDPNVPPPTPFEIDAVAYVGYLAADCVVNEGRDRPSMTEVVNSLERALAACLTQPTFSGSFSSIAEVVNSLEMALAAILSPRVLSRSASAITACLPRPKFIRSSTA